MSKSEGYKDTFIGNLKEQTGKLFGSKKLEAEGHAQHAQGHAERGVAKEREYIEGKTDNPGYRTTRDRGYGGDIAAHDKYDDDRTVGHDRSYPDSSRDPIYRDSTATTHRDPSTGHTPGWEREKYEEADRERALQRDKEWAREREVQGSPKENYTAIGGKKVSGSDSPHPKRREGEVYDDRTTTEEKHSSGLGEKIKGTTKEKTGKLTGNERLRREGTAEKVEGEIRRSDYA